jgi:spore coat protein A
MTRREFLYAGFSSGLLMKQGASPGTGILDPNRLAKFVDCLPIPPRAQISDLRPNPDHPAQQIPYYRLRMQALGTKVHRDLPPTRVWGFEGTSPGPTIETRRGNPLLVEWANELPREHFLPVDYSIHGSGHDVPAVRTVIHLHGGRVPPGSDGYPENWFRPGESRFNFYPNIQEATMLWYHDHAMGITRLNMFAGLFGLYIVRDQAEDALPLPRGARELPLVLCDRSLCEDGRLYYPISANPGQPWIPEFFGEAILVNGKLFPYCDVQPCKYRLRLLNASNSRFYYLSLSNGESFQQIGSGQGLLASPVEVKRLTLARGERADLIVDFARNASGEVVLKSDAYTIMQFRVSGKAVSSDRKLPASLRAIEKIPEREAVRTRLLTLAGVADPDDPTVMPEPMLLNNARWYDPITEKPVLNTTEIWSLVNISDDSHPIHLHLVRFQILDRRPFDVFTYLNDKELKYTADPVPPDLNESGWKDTVRADPHMVTRIIVRFEGFAGRYVWHCHVLEHEDNEMMRPYEVLPAG